MMLLITPSPALNIAPPARQSRTFIAVDASGVIMETIMKRSIPPPREPQIDSHAFYFAATLMRTKMGTNTNIRRILATIHITRFKVVKPQIIFSVVDFPEPFSPIKP